MTVRFVPCLPRATPIHDIRKFSSKEAAQESARMTQIWYVAISGTGFARAYTAATYSIMPHRNDGAT